MQQRDMLNKMFSQQREFMNLLKEKRNFPEFPVDLSTKQGQKFVKSISHECMHELFESVQLLSDSKDHKNSLSGDFNKEKFLEELADVGDRNSSSNKIYMNKLKLFCKIFKLKDLETWTIQDIDKGDWEI